MGGGLNADLSRYAVPVLWSERPTATAEGSRRHVLQVADVMRHVPDGGGTGLGRRPRYQRYRLLLSDGVYSQHATLAPSLHHLDLRRGSVVLLLRFVRVHDPDPDHLRIIVIFKLKVLQTECALIGSLKLYKPPRNLGVFSTRRSMSYGLRSDCKPSFGVQHIRYGPSYGSYSSGGDRLSSIALSEKPPVWKVVGQIKDENLGYSDKPYLITVKGTITYVNVGLLYVACPLVFNGKQCNAKATSNVDGMWRCNRCGYSFSEPSKYGCSVRIQIQNHAGTLSATAYEEDVEEILGCRAKDLCMMKYKEHDHEQLDDVIRRAVGEQYVFQLMVRLVSSGLKCIVLKAEKVNALAESHRLLGQINRLLQEGSGSGLEFQSPTMPTYTGSLDSRVCSSVRRSPNSINSDCANSPQLRALMIQQQLRGYAVSEQQSRMCSFAGKP